MNQLKCTIDDCPKDATHTFVWPWGTPGACCDQHVVIVKQRSESTRGEMGTVSFSRLDPDRPLAVEPSERVMLIAQKLGAEAERDEVKLRAEKLFSSNTELSKELRLLRARAVQLEVDAAELRNQLVAAQRERDAANLAAHDARVEAERFGGFGDLTPTETPAARAVTPPDHVIPELQPASIGPVETPGHGMGG